jgi:hypothetical protein
MLFYSIKRSIQKLQKNFYVTFFVFLTSRHFEMANVEIFLVNSKNSTLKIRVLRSLNRLINPYNNFKIQRPLGYIAVFQYYTYIFF